MAEGKRGWQFWASVAGGVLLVLAALFLVTEQTRMQAGFDRELGPQA